MNNGRESQRSTKPELSRNLDLFWSRPTREREEFADRFGREFRARHGTRIPFPQRLDEPTIRLDGLEPSWFQPPKPTAKPG